MAGVHFLPRAAAGAILFFCCLLAHATLVAIAPSRDGLAIAADSRLTFLGAECDGTFKILTPARPVRTVAVVTGDAVFVAPPPAGTSDLCGYLAAAPRLLDMGAVVTASLEQAGDDAARISLADLSTACVRAVERFHHAYPAALRAYAGREIFSVVVASYDPARRVPVLRRFVVRMNPVGQRVEAADQNETQFDRQSTRAMWVYGETGWVNRTVFAGVGRRFLAAATLEFLRGGRPIAEVPMASAVAAAANVIAAASHAAEIDPPHGGIGGAIHVMTIGRGPRAETVAWPAAK